MSTENKIIDLSTLPPCQSTLYLHIKRANYVAKVWKSCTREDYYNNDISEYGWYADGKFNGWKKYSPMMLVRYLFKAMKVMVTMMNCLRITVVMKVTLTEK